MRLKRFETVALPLLLGLAFLIATYWIARYGGWSGEGDGTRLTLAADGVVREGRLVTTRFNYTNGYGYPALLAFLSQVTGVSVQGLQIAGSAWLTVIVLLAFLAFRELLHSARLAAAGVLLLLAQPDFLFYILRNSHERTTWTFGLLVLWLWVRSGRMYGLPALAAGVCTVYLLLWAMIANNAYLGSSIVTTFLIALALSMLLKRVAPVLAPKLSGSLVERRVKFFPLVGFALVFIFVSYAYRPAQGYYQTLNSALSRTTALVAGVQPAARPYRYVATAWISTPTYLALTMVQWSIVLASGAAWLRDAALLLRQGKAALSRGRLLLWLFYLGYAAQLAFGFTADFAGWLGVNTQVRLFTPFALVTSPMAATWLAGDWTKRLRARSALRMVALPLGCLAVAFSLIKMTNDPVLGNQWLFYSPSDQAGFDWADAHLRDREIWVDTYEHQTDIAHYRKGYDWQPANNYRYGAGFDQIAFVMLSQRIELRANRTGLQLPGVANRDSIYDNGDAQLYHRRPATPFQK